LGAENVFVRQRNARKGMRIAGFQRSVSGVRLSQRLFCRRIDKRCKSVMRNNSLRLI